MEELDSRPGVVRNIARRRLFLQRTPASGPSPIAVTICEDVDGTKVRPKNRTVDSAGRYVIRITLPVYVGRAVDRQFHLTLRDDAPLLAVAVWRYLTDRLDIEEHDLMIGALR